LDLIQLVGANINYHFSLCSLDRSDSLLLMGKNDTLLAEATQEAHAQLS